MGIFAFLFFTRCVFETEIEVLFPVFLSRTLAKKGIIFDLGSAGAPNSFRASRPERSDRQHLLIEDQKSLRLLQFAEKPSRFEYFREKPEMHLPENSNFNRNPCLCSLQALEQSESNSK